jgi:IS5 family transposase
MRKVARSARDFTNQRYRWGNRVDEQIKAVNRTKSKVRSKVEHAIGVIKRVFGFQKVRYRGLAKNLHRLQVTAGLANLFMVRRRLLRAA